MPTREDRNTVLGISPRGSIALYKAAKAFAYIYDREYVTPDDVKNTAVSVLSHRIILSPQGKDRFRNRRGICGMICSKTARFHAMGLDNEKYQRVSSAYLQ